MELLKDTQAVVNPVMADTVEYSDHAKKVIAKIMDDLKKNSKELKSPDTGKKMVKNMYTEKLILDESLFEETSNKLSEDIHIRKRRQFREGSESYKDKIWELIDGMPDLAKTVAEDLLRWMSEDDVEDMIRINDMLPDDDVIDPYFEEDGGVRAYTNWLYDSIADEAVDPKYIAQACIKYLPESDLKRYAEVVELFDSDDVSEKFAHSINKIAKRKSLSEAPEITDWSKKWSDYEDDEEEDVETVFDFVDERLFGISRTGVRNPSNYRVTTKFVDDVRIPLVGLRGKSTTATMYPVNVGSNLVADESKSDDRRAPYSGGIGVYLREKEEGNLAEAVAKELQLDFDIKPVRGKTYKYIARIKMPDEIAEMPIEKYLESIGKSIKQYRKNKKRVRKQ